MHYYSFNVADYRKDTHHLEPMEHYIYRFLMDSYYLNERPIPKETQSVMRRLRLATEHLKYLENVLNDFFTLADDGWHHGRIDMEIAEYHGKCQKNALNGKKGGRPKKQGLTDGNKPKKTQSVNFANPNESELKPNQEPLTNNQEPIKSIVGQAQLAIDYLNDVCYSNFMGVDSNLNLVKARFKDGYTLADVKAVIDSKAKEWRNTDQDKFLRPKTLFSATNFSNYHGQIGKDYGSKNGESVMKQCERLGISTIGVNTEAELINLIRERTK